MSLSFGKCGKSGFYRIQGSTVTARCGWTWGHEGPCSWELAYGMESYANYVDKVPRRALSPHPRLDWRDEMDHIAEYSFGPQTVCEAHTLARLRVLVDVATLAPISEAACHRFAWLARSFSPEEVAVIVAVRGYRPLVLRRHVGIEVGYATA